MISLEQIEEWINEAKQRPASAALIIEFVGKRLIDLSARNEELLSDNILLRTEKKVEDYEKRIANLEYQLQILKRQVSDPSDFPSLAGSKEKTRLIVYSHKGYALSTNLSLDGNVSRLEIGSFTSEISRDELPPRLIVTSSVEELLFVFDSGRTEAIPASSIPVCEAGRLDWQRAIFVEPHGKEELTTVLPIGRMALFDFCVQTSRRGCIKKMMKSSFESHVLKNYVGSGVKQKPDITFMLNFAMRTDRLALATHEGFVVNHPVDGLPFTIEECIRLSATDYIVSTFVILPGKTFVAITQNGKVLQREPNWLEFSDSFNSRGQAIFSQSRRETGARCAGAACADGEDWAFLLLSNGKVMAYKMKELYASGAVPETGIDVSVIDFMSQA